MVLNLCGRRIAAAAIDKDQFNIAARCLGFQMIKQGVNSIFLIKNRDYDADSFCPTHGITKIVQLNLVEADCGLKQMAGIIRRVIRCEHQVNVNDYQQSVETHVPKIHNPFLSGSCIE